MKNGKSAEALGLDEVDAGRFRKEACKPALAQGKGYLRVTAVAAGETKGDAPPQTVALDCFVGENWVVTAHDAGAEVLEEFRDRVEGEGALGATRRTVLPRRASGMGRDELPASVRSGRGRPGRVRCPRPTQPCGATPSVISAS